ncbi:MAG TPA: alpha-amylase family glycosyl hydrolase [Bacteroidales bacterium]|nr:alpha-amylase family glycosyl hydrolase [Bacteroidales bacterium]
MKKVVLLFIVPGFILAGFGSCKTNPAELKANYPEWAKNAVIYEVNIRQYTPEGTFKAFEAHLPRLKELGADILWFMPIHPIGVKNRKMPEGMKESLGSYYSVRDYKGVNPEFGTEEDFKNLVAKAHEMGFKVIIDWVANHTAWDNQWVTGHPEWYEKDSTGKILSPFGWADVAKLDYRNKDMRKEMIASMKYWIERCDIDGFRCDVAGEVPVDFWEQARAELEKTKPLFMLAENEDKPQLLMKAFDANYGWRMHQLMHDIAKGKDSVHSIVKQVLKVDSVIPKNTFQINFITNHDENSWNGTAQEKFGPGENAFALLTYTLPGMPLIYSGQEAGLNKRLAFFVKDTINWEGNDLSPFYEKLNALKHGNEALWNAPYGGRFELVKNTVPGKVLSFIRKKGKNKVLVIVNLSNKYATVNLKGDKADGDYTDVFSGAAFTLNSSTLNLTLQPWGYWVMEAK